MTKAILIAAFLVVTLTGSVLAGGGKASWYGPKFDGRTTASGERFNQYAATCAHRSYRFGTRLKVTNLRNGRTATCRVNDRGPSVITGRSLDVSRGVAKQLGMVRSGVAPVKWTVIK